MQVRSFTGSEGTEGAPEVSEISEYIAISIAEGRLKKAKDKLRDKEISEAVVTRLDAEKAKGGA